MHTNPRSDECPYCGSDEIEGGHISVEGEDIGQSCFCNDCQRDFTLHFVLLAVLDSSNAKSTRRNLTAVVAPCTGDPVRREHVVKSMLDILDEDQVMAEMLVNRLNNRYHKLFYDEY